MNRRPPRATKADGKVSPVWFIVIGASVLLSAALLILRPSPKFLRRETTPIAMPVSDDTVSDDTMAVPAPEPIPVASNPRAGIGIKRLAVVGALSARPYNFSFRDGRPLNDESNYLGFSRSLPRASIQILGRPDDIAEAAYNDVILPDTVWKVVAISTAMEFARSIDGDAMPWVAETLKKVRENRSCFATRVIAGRAWTISYSQLGPEGHLLVRAGLPKSRPAAAQAAP